MVTSQSRCEWLSIFVADEYVMIGIGTQRDNVHIRVFKPLLNQRSSERYDDVWFRYGVLDFFENVCIPESAELKAYIVMRRLKTENAKSSSTKFLNGLCQ